jgi:hypothetical protein
VSLRSSHIGQLLIRQDRYRYHKYPWASEAILPGICRLRLPIPDSNRKIFAEQKALLLDGEDVAPLVLVELALLCLKKAGLPNPLQNGWVRCREVAGGRRVGLHCADGRLYVSADWDDVSYGSVWLASVRRAS